MTAAKNSKPATKPEAPARAPAKELNTKNKSGETVTVFCRIPNGLEMQIYEPRPITTRTPSGVIEEIQMFAKGAPVRVRGPGVSHLDPAFPRPQMAGGAALTLGVSKDFMDEWLEQNHLNPIVTGGHIGYHGKTGHAVGMAKERSDVRTGLEPMQAEKDPRAEKPLNPKVEEIKTAEENASKFHPDAAA